jgi:hypothetical protein
MIADDELFRITGILLHMDKNKRLTLRNACALHVLQAQTSIYAQSVVPHEHSRPHQKHHVPNTVPKALSQSCLASIQHRDMFKNRARKQ